MAISTPEFQAQGTHRGAVVYFSSASENTARFMAGCQLDTLGINVYRIPMHMNAEPLEIDEPFVLIVPTYGGGNMAKAVPPQVKRFLNNPSNRIWIRGVIASGNTNFGEAYCSAGDLVSAKCHVPYLYKFELMGTQEDREAVRRGLLTFFDDLAAGKVDVPGMQEAQERSRALLQTAHELAH